MMPSEELQVFKEGGIFHIRLNSPSSKNAVSLELSQHLYNILHSPILGENIEGCGLLVISSALDDIFASGGNLKELAEVSREESLKLIENMQNVCLKLSQFPIPTVTLLNGPCYGGGAELALATDFRISISEKTAFHFGQTKWAVPGGWHGTSRLQQISFPTWGRRVGIAMATEESFSEQKAMRFGILDEAFESPDEAIEWLNKKSNSFLSCNKQLRQDLMNRKTVDSDSWSQQRDLDNTLFQKYWKKGAHEEKLLAWKKKKGKA